MARAQQRWKNRSNITAGNCTFPFLISPSTLERERERGGAEWRKVGRETAQSDRIKRSNEHRVVNYLAGDGKGQRWDGQRRGKGKKRDTGGATKDYIRDTGQRPSSFATSNQT